MRKRSNKTDRQAPGRARGSSPGTYEQTVHVGVVQSGSTICHVCAATSPERLTQRLADYVRVNAPYQLCPDDARRVLALLERGRAQQAVDQYFGVASQRWDREKLIVRKTGRWSR